MSYVFSKALQETPEQKERRLKAQQEKWKAKNAAYDPKAYSHLNQPDTDNNNNDNIKQSQEATEGSISTTMRKTSLPKRSYTIDSEFETGQKMGGAFARLQAQLNTSETKMGGIYSEAYEAYRARRSLKEHGVLPKDMRGTEMQRKYSLDKGQPPIILPKPSADARRTVFSRNRSMTTPSSTSNIKSEPLTSASLAKKNSIIEEPAIQSGTGNEERTTAQIAVEKEKDDLNLPEVVQLEKNVPTSEKIISPQDNTKMEVTLIEGNESVANLNAKTQEEEIKLDEKTQYSSEGKPKDLFGIDTDEIKKVEQSEEVMAMKQEIDAEKLKWSEAKQNLDSTIDELENLDLELAFSHATEKKTTVNELQQITSKDESNVDRLIEQESKEENFNKEEVNKTMPKSENTAPELADAPTTYTLTAPLAISLPPAEKESVMEDHANIENEKEDIFLSLESEDPLKTAKTPPCTPTDEKKEMPLKITQGKLSNSNQSLEMLLESSPLQFQSEKVSFFQVEESSRPLNQSDEQTIVAENLETSINNNNTATTPVLLTTESSTTETT